MAIAELFTELADIADRCVEARAGIREYLNTCPNIGLLEVNVSETETAGHAVFSDQCSDGLLLCLLASRALDRKSNGLGVGQSHKSPMSNCETILA